MIKAIATRRSVRDYTDKEVGDTILLKILESARLAPSGHNTQPWDFIIVRGKQMRSALAHANHQQKWMEKAPVHIVAVSGVQREDGVQTPFVDETTGALGLKRGIRDTAIACTHILLAAEELGLGTCWCGWHTQEDVRSLLGIPQDRYVVGIITMGYPAEHPDPRPRRPLENMVHYEKWAGKSFCSSN